MEQWCKDGRDIIYKRGLSYIPPIVESDGYVIDMSGGLRGLLRKPSSTPYQINEGPAYSYKPKQYATCQVEYEYIYNDKVIDSNINTGYPLEIIVGAGHVTQGMDEAILDTYKGETTEWWLDPAFAFREHGVRSEKGSIPADAAVQLRLRLVSFVNPMTPAERVAKAGELKIEGNELCSTQGEFKKAIALYRDALHVLGYKFSRDGTIKPHTEEEKVTFEAIMKELEREDVSLRSVLSSNIATCWFNLGDFSQAIIFANKALKYNMRNAKALFRKASALAANGELEAAIELLQEMVVNKLGDVGVIEEKLKEFCQLNKVQTSKEQKAFRKMFFAI